MYTVYLNTTATKLVVIPQRNTLKTFGDRNRDRQTDRQTETEALWAYRNTKTSKTESRYLNREKDRMVEPLILPYILRRKLWNGESLSLVFDLWPHLLVLPMWIRMKKMVMNATRLSVITDSHCLTGRLLSSSSFLLCSLSRCCQFSGLCHNSILVFLYSLGTSWSFEYSSKSSAVFVFCA